jgi:hypothetical protein
MAGDKEKAMAASCDDFDTKPVDLPGLLGENQGADASKVRIMKSASAPLSHLRVQVLLTVQASADKVIV